MKIYVKVDRPKNRDGDKLYKVTTYKSKPKRYSFVVGGDKS